MERESRRNFVKKTAAVTTGVLTSTLPVDAFVNVSDNNSFDLIETFAYEILNSLRKYNNISRATVTIHKPNSPLKELVEDISVTASEEF